MLSARSSSNPNGVAMRRVAVHGWGMAYCGALFLILLLIALQSARLGIAGLNVEFGQGQVDRWTASRQPQGMRDVSRFASHFTESLRYAPDNPWALEGLGALNLARMRLSTVPREAVAYTRGAHRQFAQALQQRPASAFLWANLALSKLYLGEIDGEFFAALRNANELGPWQPATQQTVLFAGLAAWDKLDSGLRQSLASSLERGASRNAAKMFEIVKTYRRFDLVCGIHGYNSLAGKDCRRSDSGAKFGLPMTKGKG